MPLILQVLDHPAKHRRHSSLSLICFTQPVRVICDGQTNCAGEADDELSGQRQAGHAERCGPVSQGNSGITVLMHQECIGIPRKNVQQLRGVVTFVF